MMEPPHPATLPAEALAHVCVIADGRVSGPGEQHRNRVATGVFVRHPATSVDAQGTERRSQVENRHMALRRIRKKRAITVRTPASHDHHDCPPPQVQRPQGQHDVRASEAQRPSRAAGGGARVIEARRYDMGGAATLPGNTMRQLRPLIRPTQHAPARVNDWREACGLPRLRI
jgi:hypothetical protein